MTMRRSIPLLPIFRLSRPSRNGQDAAFRMFTVIGIVLTLLTQPDGDGQS